MALFKKIFGKSEKKTPRGFDSVRISSLTKLTSDTVKVGFDIPSELKHNFRFKAGQYINVIVPINGKDQRRSYSICSAADQELSVAVKEVENGQVSSWFNNEAEQGTEILISKPEGSFVRPDAAKNIVCIAAGSGITPIMSIAHDIEKNGGSLNLFYGNRTVDSIIFKSELDALNSTKVEYFLSGEERDGFQAGRLDKENFTAVIKSDLDLLKKDAFFLCGPEQMILDVSETLKMFGVAEDKIHFELFTDPVLMKSKTEEINNFSGSSVATVILDNDEVTFEMKEGQIVLDTAIANGVDAPYSCKGGVCSTCKAKVLEGKVSMKLNYSLTDKEIEEGYILSCQSHAASPKIVVSYDEA